MSIFKFGFLAALLAGTTFVFTGCNPSHASAGLVAIKPAPAWTLKNLDGQDVSFSEFKGKVVVIDFWATWCGPCLSEIPGYIELQKKYGKDGLVIVGVSMDTIKVQDVAKFVKKQGMNYTVLMADDEIVAAFGNFNVIPTTFLIDREGRIIHQKSGQWKHEDYEALVKKAL